MGRVVLTGETEETEVVVHYRGVRLGDVVRDVRQHTTFANLVGKHDCVRAYSLLGTWQNRLPRTPANNMSDPSIHAEKVV